MRVFLTGGTGFVGSAIREALRGEGHDIVALARRARGPEPGVVWVPGEIGDVDALTTGMQGCDAVVHLVGIIAERGKATFPAIHVQGTANVLAAMRQQGITRLLHMSALGAAQKADTAYYRTKWEAEELVRAAGVAFTIFRPSIIFGPGDGVISRLVQQIRHWPVIPIIGDGQYAMAVISIHAVAAAFAQALRLPETAGKTFELCGPEVLTYEAILDLLMAHMGKHRPKVHLPIDLLRAVTGTTGAMHLPSPITGDQLRMLLAGSVCTTTDAREVFELPEITLAEGIKEYIRG